MIMSLLKQLRSHFLYGLIIILPIAATIFIVYVFFQLFLKPIEAFFGGTVSVFITLISSLVLISFIGFLSRYVGGTVFTGFN